MLFFELPENLSPYALHVTDVHSRLGKFKQWNSLARLLKVKDKPTVGDVLFRELSYYWGDLRGVELLVENGTFHTEHKGTLEFALAPIVAARWLTTDATPPL